MLGETFQSQNVFLLFYKDAKIITSPVESPEFRIKEEIVYVNHIFYNFWNLPQGILKWPSKQTNRRDLFIVYYILFSDSVE